MKGNNNPLHDLLFLERDAREFGFDWPNEQMIVDQVIDECREILEAIENDEGRDRIQEEMGDLIHAVISLCRFTGFDVEETIEKTNHKFGRRMNALKKVTQETGLDNLHGKSIEFMLELWKKAKTAEC